MSKSKPMKYITGIIALLIICIAIFIVSLYIFPEAKDRAFFQFIDKKQNKATETLNEDLKTESIENIDPLHVMSTADIYFNQGKVDDAINILEIHLKKSPDNIVLLDKLGSYYKYKNNYKKYGELLEKKYSVQPDNATLRNIYLVGLITNNTDVQEKALTQMVKNNSATTTDYISLAKLYEKQGKNLLATNVIESLFIDTKIEDIDEYENKFFIINLYLKNKKYNQAFEITKQIDYKDTQELLDLASIFSENSQNTMALELLEPIEQELYKNPKLLERYTAINIQDKNDKFISNLVTNIPLNKINSTTQQAVADYLLDNKNAADAKIFLSRLENSSLSPEPLVIMTLNSAIGVKQEKSKLTARDYAKYSVKKRLRVLNILINNDLTKDAEIVLKSFTPNTYYTNDDLENIVYFYLISDKEDQAKRLLGSLRFKTNNDFIPIIFAVYNQKNTKIVKNWITKNNSLPSEELEPKLFILYNLAIKIKNYKVAAIIAKDIYQKNPNPNNKLTLANAYFFNEQYKEALPIYEDSLRQGNKTILGNYLISLLKTQKNISDKKLNYIIQDNIKDLSDTEKRNIAYTLSEYNQRTLAEKIFFELANSPNAREPDDFDQLIYIWGPKPTAQQVAWINKKAFSSKNPQYWIEKLDYLGDSKGVVDLYNKNERILSQDFNAYSIYLRNLVLVTNNKNTLHNIINKEINNTNSAQKLPLLIDIAQAERFDDAVQHGLEKLSKTNPTTENYKALADYYYDHRNLDKSKKYIELMIQENKKLDPALKYKYAEILEGDRNYKLSKIYYKEVYEETCCNKNLAPNLRVLAPMSLQRLHKIRSADKEYKKLLAEYPHNRQVKLSYAAFLLDIKRYNKAEELL